jgi:hypothetical protein
MTKTSKPIVDLKEVVNYWKSRLGLSDWDMEVRFVEPRELHRDKTAVAEANWTISRRIGTLRVVKPEYSQEYSPAEIEKSVVHEMLHLTFGYASEFIPDPPANVASITYEVCLEQPIDLLACTLVKLRQSSADPKDHYGWENKLKDAADALRTKRKLEREQRLA